MSPFALLDDNPLRLLRDSLAEGRLTVSATELGLARIVGISNAAAVAAELSRLAEKGWDAGDVAMLLAALVDGRSRSTPLAADLVITGPQVPGISTRSTAAVVEELFAAAERRVLVVGYVVYQGQKIFRRLAERMAERPGLDVSLVLNIARGRGDTTLAADLVRRFRRSFGERDWPSGFALPRLFYLPAAVEAGSRSTLHAKCVVVDDRAFVSSANFTDAAQHRNIEVGMISDVSAHSAGLIDYFNALCDAGILRSVPDV